MRLWDVQHEAVLRLNMTEVPVLNNNERHNFEEINDWLHAADGHLVLLGRYGTVVNPQYRISKF